MNKILTFLSLSILVLGVTSCNPTTTSSSLDDNWSYNIDETISNAGSTAKYEIYVRSFYDSDGNGIGDFGGLAEKMSYIKQMGFGGVWLMPIMKGSSEHKYDVVDYYDTDPEYGSLSDFDEMIEVANENNVEIYIDLVVNHSSKENEWFLQSARDYATYNTSSTSKKDWYNWSPTSQTGYHYNDVANAYYEGRFSDWMPDLNLNNAQVRDEIVKLCKFWIDRGVKGFRLDGVEYYYYGSPGSNREFLTWFQSEMLEIDSSIYIVGEAWDSSSTSLARYYEVPNTTFFDFNYAAGMGNGFVSSVNSQLGNAMSERYSNYINNYVKSYGEDRYTSPFATNHDMNRLSHMSSELQNKAIASFYLLLPGTPYVYYGEEIRMIGYRKVGSNTDADRRLPFIWSEHNKLGQTTMLSAASTSEEDQVKLGALDNLLIADSVTNHYRKVISLRNKYPFIFDCEMKNMTFKLGQGQTATSIAGFSYKSDEGNIIVLHNTSDIVQEVTLNGAANSILEQIATSKINASIDEDVLTIHPYSSVILNNLK